MLSAGIRIVHVIQEIPPSSGGPTAAVLGLAAFQNRCGDAASIACFGGMTGNERVRIDRIPVQGTSHSVGWLEDSWLKERPDIIHVHGVWDPVVRAAAWASSRVGVPWVLSSHGMLHPEAIAHHRIRKALYLAMFGRLIGRACHVMALNDEESVNVSARFRAPVSVIPAGIDFPEIEPIPTGAFRRSVPGLGVAPFLLFIGRLDRIKGIDLLVDSFAAAVARGIGHHLVIAGPDFGEAPALTSQIASAGLNGRIHLVGPIWGDRKRDALAECSAFVHRPRFEGYGLAVVEAMAAGRAVLVTPKCRLDASSVTGVVRVAPDSTAGFAEAMLALVDDAAALKAMGAAAREWARTHAGWDARGAQARAVYSEAIAADGRWSSGTAVGARESP